MTIADPCPRLSHEPLVRFPVTKFYQVHRSRVAKTFVVKKLYFDAKSQALNDSNLNTLEK
jgi:hypothetical protein